MNFREIDENYDFEQNEAIIWDNINILREALDDSDFSNEELFSMVDYINNQLSTFGEKATPLLEDAETIERYNAMLYAIRDVRERINGRSHTPTPNPNPNPDPTPNPNPNPGPTPNPNPNPNPGPEPKPTLDDKIKEFEDKTSKMEEDIREILDSLTYEEKYKDSVEMVKQLDTEFQEIRDFAEDLKNDIKNFRDNNLGNPKLTVSQIDKKIRELRAKLRNIKATQRDQYNAKVDFVNMKIDSLKEELKNRANDPSIDEITRKAIENLTHINKSTGSYFLEGNMGYLDNIDYNKLLEMINLTNKLEEKIGKEPEKIDLESDIVTIENKLKEISEKIAPEMTQNEILALMDDLSVANTLVTLFENKLSSCKDKITPEVYDAYDNRLTAAKNEIARLREEIGKIKVPGKENNVYLGFQRELDMLNGQVTDFGLRIGKESIVETDLPRWKDDLDKLEQSLEEIGNRIDEAFHNGLLDDNHIKNLSETYNEIKQKIEENRKKLNDPENIKHIDDVFDFLNGQIDGLEAAITALEAQIDSLQKPIKDKNVRKQIDKTIVRLEEEIKVIRSLLEKYKDKDPDKYEEASKRLQEQEERLKQISKKYRKKCPLIVRAKKSAKEFYKNHKKLVLIAAGLAAIALIHATIGPIIMPSIMHGNLMIMSKVPSLRPMFMGINSILGKLINAKDIAGIWTLANGVTINPSCAAVSLLKGIAISGIGTAALITPVILAIKELYNKMSKAELKEKMSKGKGKIKDTIGGTKEKVKDSVSKVKNKVKDRDKKPKIDSKYLKLYKEYKLYGGTLEEFAQDKGLDERYIAILRGLDMMYSVEENTETNSRSGGRR